MLRPRVACLSGLLVLAVAGCANPAAAPAPRSSTSSTTTAVSTTVPTTTTTPTPAAVVVLDPGHNGGNAAHPEEINRPVPAGRGRTKPCNTTGTSTDAGYPEHAFTWDVTVRVRDILTAQGVQVILTRENDTGVGPCVDERAAVGNRAGAAAVVSIHADGSTDPDAQGFHVAYAAPPLNESQGGPAIRLATTMRDRLSAAGFPLSTYIGTEGLSPRDDLAGLNLSERPAVLVECGNMRNPQEAETFTSEQGRDSYAKAIAEGILTYLRT